MNTYILLLRGINISGHNIIKMNDLKLILADLGLSNINTYLQSGNVIFDYYDENIKELELNIKNRIKEKYSYNIENIILSIENIIECIDKCPYQQEENSEIAQVYFTFIISNSIEKKYNLIEEKLQNGEQISFTEDVIYLFLPDGYGKTKVHNNFIESKLNIIATTRNYKTTKEILRLAQINKSMYK